MQKYDMIVIRMIRGVCLMTIGERIKTIRKSKKISVDTIANQLGISKTTIYRYEDSTIEKIPLQVIEK